jgi:hypothetical protein
VHRRGAPTPRLGLLEAGDNETVFGRVVADMALCLRRGLQKSCRHSCHGCTGECRREGRFEALGGVFHCPQQLANRAVRRKQRYPPARKVCAHACWQRILRLLRQEDIGVLTVERRAPRRFERVDEDVTRAQSAPTLERIKQLTQEENQRLRALMDDGQGQGRIICGDDMVPSGLQHCGKDSSLCWACGRDESVRHLPVPFPIFCHMPPPPL